MNDDEVVDGTFCAVVGNEDVVVASSQYETVSVKSGARPSAVPFGCMLLVGEPERVIWCVGAWPIVPPDGFGIAYTHDGGGHWAIASTKGAIADVGMMGAASVFRDDLAMVDRRTGQVWTARIGSDGGVVLQRLGSPPVDWGADAFFSAERTCVIGTLDRSQCGVGAAFGNECEKWMISCRTGNSEDAEWSPLSMPAMPVVASTWEGTLWSVDHQHRARFSYATEPSYWETVDLGGYQAISVSPIGARAYVLAEKAGRETVFEIQRGAVVFSLETDLHTFRGYRNFSAIGGALVMNTSSGVVALRERKFVQVLRAASGHVR